MSASSKIITVTLVGGGVVAGAAYLHRLLNTRAELEVEPTVSLHKVGLTGITIRVDVLLKNPARGTFSIKFPFVKLIYRDTTIGSSQVVDREITIPPFGEARIEGILIQLPLLSIFSIGTSIYSLIKQNKPVAMSLKVITSINLGWTKIPYEDTRDVILNIPKEKPGDTKKDSTKTNSDAGKNSKTDKSGK